MKEEAKKTVKIKKKVDAADDDDEICNIIKSFNWPFLLPFFIIFLVSSSFYAYKTPISMINSMISDCSPLWWSLSFYFILSSHNTSVWPLGI